MTSFNVMRGNGVNIDQMETKLQFRFGHRPSEFSFLQKRRVNA